MPALSELLPRFQYAAESLTRLVEDLELALTQGRPDESWVFPVDDPEDWYCAVWHDLTGQRNGGYRHTGLDLNLCRKPFGDVERGFPVYALGNGIVTAATGSAGWLGVVQVLHTHSASPLWTRYAHLDDGRLMVRPGQVVNAGQLLGYIGNWQGGDGGDHLHLDMATTPFYWAAWRSAADAWVDPVYVLKAHLDPDRVNALLARA